MTPFARFLAFEAVGWVAAAVVLAALVRTEYVSLGWACVLFALWAAKDFALYPLTKSAYEDGHAHGAAGLLGREVRVETALEPEGWVRAGAERWRAELAAGCDERVEAGARVRVSALKGLTLVVEPLASGQDRRSRADAKRPRPSSSAVPGSGTVE